MPTILEVGGFRFFFYSLDRSEPPHVHVAHGSKVAKYWLQAVELARSEGFRAHELNRLREMVLQHATAFQRKWDEHFSSDTGRDRS